jgi:hypothetical protein
MPTPKDDLKDRLARYRQIRISAVGWKSGQMISIPVWFLLEGRTLYLLPVRGSGTYWNVGLAPTTALSPQPSMPHTSSNSADSGRRPVCRVCGV